MGTSEYYNHLAGDDINENLDNINYTDVTFNMEKYYKETTVMYNGEIDENVGAEIRTRSNHFKYGTFTKCYGLDVKKSKLRNIDFVDYYFTLDTFAQNFMSTKQIFVVFHAPSQIVLSPNHQFFSFDINHTDGFYLYLQINKVEVVKRRNKPSNPCIQQSRNWDDVIFLKHIKDIGCVPFYYNLHQEYPFCSTINDTKKWYDIWTTLKNDADYLPCQTMPRIDFSLTQTGYKVPKGSLLVSVAYSEQVKVITQSRAVDFNALIGNIGGYIGLFLGYAIIQLPDLLLVLYERLKKIMGCRNLPNTGTVAIDAAPIQILVSTVPRQSQTKAEANSVMNRGSRVEEDNVKLFRKLDEILVAMDKSINTRTHQIRTD